MSNLFKIISILLITSLLLANTVVHKQSIPPLILTESTPIWDIMTSLGKVNVNVLHPQKNGIIHKGRQLVTTGITINEKGKQTPPTSRKLTCVACHTLQNEYFEPVVINPEKRLEYADSMNLPFLPGTPFRGIVNRVRFFNDDYQKIFSNKKAKALKKGHNNIREAIQTCNQVYAKGRELKEWEIESILAFFWTIELKLGELKISSEDLASIKKSIETNRQNARAVNLMRRYYREVYPATLVAPLPIDQRRQISPIINNFQNGRILYQRACLHCHENKRYANFSLDSRQKTFKFLKKHFDNDKSVYSIYTSSRYNPDSKLDRKGTPHYTAERMSDQQLQDLRFFILKMAQLGNEAYQSYK